jgi:hypothetical protein
MTALILLAIAIGILTFLLVLCYILIYAARTSQEYHHTRLKQLEDITYKLPSNEYMKNRFDEMKQTRADVTLILNKLKTHVIVDPKTNKRVLADSLPYAVRVLIDPVTDTWIYVTNTDQEPILFTDRTEADQFAQPFRIKGKENNVEVVLYK